MFWFIKTKSDWPYNIDFNQENLKIHLGALTEKAMGNIISAMDIYYSIAIKQEIENRIENRDSDKDFELKMQWLLKFRKYLKKYFDEKSVAKG